MAEITQNRPRRIFRIIRGEGGNYKVQYYSSQERRDAAAQKFADKDGTNVVTELWDADHSQDRLNLGWACDGHREPADAHGTDLSQVIT